MPETNTQNLTAPVTVITPAAGTGEPFNPLPKAPLDYVQQMWGKIHPGAATPTSPAPVTPPAPLESPKPAPAAVTNEPPKPAETAKPAEPAKAAEAAEVLDPDIEKWRPPRNKGDWASYKAQATKQIKVMSEKLADYEKRLGGQDFAALEQVVKERDELRQKLQSMDLAADPQFSKEFTAKESALISAAKRAAGDQSSAVEVLLQAPPSEWRSKMLDELELSPGRAASLGAAIFALDTLRADRDAKLKDAPTITAQLNAQRQMQTQQQQKALLEQFESRGSEWQKQFPFLAQNPEFSNTAKKFFSGSIGVEDAMDAAFSAAAYPIVLQSHLDVSKENESLKDELAKFKAGVPNPGGGPGPTASVSVGQDESFNQLRSGTTTLGNLTSKLLREKGLIR